MNIVNPFQGGAVELEIPDVQQRVSTYPLAPALVKAPTVPGLIVQDCNTAATLNVISALTTIISRISNGAIQCLNSQQINAIQNTWQVFINITTNTDVAFNTQQLQDIVIANNAITYVAPTGGLITAADVAANPNSQIKSANTGWFPDGALTLTCADQYMIAEQPNTGAFFWSNSANAMDWSVLNTADMEFASDQPIAVDTGPSNLLIAFGVQSIEFYQDVPSSYPAVWEAIPPMALNYGLAARYSEKQFMGSIAFLGANKTGQVHMMLLQPGSSAPQIISTPDIDTIINSFPVVNDAFAYTTDFNGHSWYVLTFPTAQRTFVYDGTTAIPFEWQSGIAPYNRHLTTLAITFNGSTLASDYASGNIYLIDPNALTDNGFLIRREFTSRHVNMDGNEFTVAELWLDINTGSGQQTGLGTNPFMELSVSTDNGNTFRGPYPASMGLIGQHNVRVRWLELGSARDFVFKFVVTDPVPLNVLRGYAVLVPGSEVGQ